MGYTDLNKVPTSPLGAVFDNRAYTIDQALFFRKHAFSQSRRQKAIKELKN